MISIKKAALFSFLFLFFHPSFLSTAHATLLAHVFPHELGTEHPAIQKYTPVPMIDLSLLERYMTDSQTPHQTPMHEIIEGSRKIQSIPPQKSASSLNWIDLDLIEFQLSSARFLHTHNLQDLGIAYEKAKNLMHKIYREMLETYRPDYPITPESRAAAYRGKRKLFVKTQTLMSDTRANADSTLVEYYDALVEKYHTLPAFTHKTIHESKRKEFYTKRYDCNHLQAQHDLVQTNLFEDFKEKHSPSAFWERLDQMHTCYEAFSIFYWGVEDVLFYESLLDTNRGKNLHDFWHQKHHGNELRKAMASFMKRHFMIYAVKAEKV